VGRRWQAEGKAPIPIFTQNKEQINNYRQNGERNMHKTLQTFTRTDKDRMN